MYLSCLIWKELPIGDVLSESYIQGISSTVLNTDITSMPIVCSVDNSVGEIWDMCPCQLLLTITILLLWTVTYIVYYITNILKIQVPVNSL